MTIPNYASATAYLRDGLVRVDLDSPHRVVGLSFAITPHMARMLAAELLNVTATKEHASSVSVVAELRTERAQKSDLTPERSLRGTGVKESPGLPEHSRDNDAEQCANRGGDKS